MLYLIMNIDVFVSLSAKSNTYSPYPLSSSQIPQFRTGCVDFEGRDKSTGFVFGSPVSSPEPAYPALALRKPS